MELVALGGSSGGVRAISSVLAALPASFQPAVVVVVHRGLEAGNNLERHIASKVRLPVQSTMDKLPIEPGTIYIAPGGYHLLVERSRELALSLDQPVRHCRPSIDVLFESVADAFDACCAGVLLSGYGSDGARGLCAIARAGGSTAVQSPASAEVPAMVTAALELIQPDAILDLDQIADWLVAVADRGRSSRVGRGAP